HPPDQGGFRRPNIVPVQAGNGKGLQNMKLDTGITVNVVHYFFPYLNSGEVHSTQWHDLQQTATECTPTSNTTLKTVTKRLPVGDFQDPLNMGPRHRDLALRFVAKLQNVYCVNLKMVL